METIRNRDGLRKAVGITRIGDTIKRNFAKDAEIWLGLTLWI